MSEADWLAATLRSYHAEVIESVPAAMRDGLTQAFLMGGAATIAHALRVLGDFNAGPEAAIEQLFELEHALRAGIALS